MSRFDFLKYTFEFINSDLRYSEQKNTFLSMFNAAIIGALVSFASNNFKFTFPERVALLVFGVAVLFSLLLSVFSFVPIDKAIKLKKRISTQSIPKYMFYVYNDATYESGLLSAYNNFIEDIKTRSGDASGFSLFEHQLVVQIIELSYVTNRKFMFLEWQCILNFVLLQHFWFF